MSAWQELGDGVFRRRWESLDLNVGLIVTETAALVVDSRANHAQADELIDEIRLITQAPVTHLVNTHHHWDHTFGNARFPAADIVGHVRCRRELIENGEVARQSLLDADWLPDEAKPLFAEVQITPPAITFDERLEIELGERVVTLVHLGRGHTDNDIIVEVDDVLFAGDLVEEGAPPQFGDAHPREWPGTLDRLIARISGIVVPGHGDIVDRDFIEGQRDQITRAIDGDPVFPEQIMTQIRERLARD